MSCRTRLILDSCGALWQFYGGTATARDRPSDLSHPKSFVSPWLIRGVIRWSVGLICHRWPCISMGMVFDLTDIRLSIERGFFLNGFGTGFVVQWLYNPVIPLVRSGFPPSPSSPPPSPPPSLSTPADSFVGFADPWYIRPWLSGSNYASAT